MIKSFIHEIDKQIASNMELYKQTKFEIFRKRLEELKALKNEILATMQNQLLI
ncbi:MAG: hypothetical protein JSV62_06325 [Promethearchaeota archaeon]|nr:MAG: hypothetical protein JSV62_06325 [Candidatus Lokiarchaeota archaeon]